MQYQVLHAGLVHRSQMRIELAAYSGVDRRRKWECKEVDNCTGCAHSRKQNKLLQACNSFTSRTRLTTSTAGVVGEAPRHSKSATKATSPASHAAHSGVPWSGCAGEGKQTHTQAMTAPTLLGSCLTTAECKHEARAIPYEPWACSPLHREKGGWSPRPPCLDCKPCPMGSTHGSKAHTAARDSTSLSSLSNHK
jgi:hypothetical protein